MNTQQLTLQIKDLATEKGADIVGVPDLTLLKDIFTYPKDLLRKYRYGVSIGVNLEQYGSYNNTTENRAFLYLRKIAKYVGECIRSQGLESEVIPCGKRVKRKREGSL